MDKKKIKEIVEIMEEEFGCDRYIGKDGVVQGYDNLAKKIYKKVIFSEKEK
jgi:hypothetical protein